MNSRKNKISNKNIVGKIIYILPSSTWILIFTIIPFSILFLYSFWRTSNWQLIKDWNLRNYINVFTGKVFPVLLIRTFSLAIAVTIICLIFGYAVAIFIANYSGRFKNLMYIMVIIPLWTSYIVRIYSWKILLGREGIINNILIFLRIIKEPSDLLLYNYFSVFMAFIGILLPFMILPIFTTLEKIPKNLYEAAYDLGSSRINTFLRITFPISLPGVLAGSFLVFVFTVGDYLTPMLLGGAGGITLGREIYSKFGLSYEWPLGSAMSFVLLAFVLIILNLINRGGALEEL